MMHSLAAVAALWDAKLARATCPTRGNTWSNKRDISSWRPRLMDWKAHQLRLAGPQPVPPSFGDSLTTSWSDFVCLSQILVSRGMLIADRKEEPIQIQQNLQKSSWMDNPQDLPQAARNRAHWCRSKSPLLWEESLTMSRIIWFTVKGLILVIIPGCYHHF